MLAWGIGVVLNGWDVYRNDAITEEQIQKEVQRLRRRT
jgi:hypothetical protein